MKLKGGKELDAFLNAYPVKMQRNVMRGALRAGARVLQVEARANVPQKSGQLRKDIKIETDAKGGIPKARVKLKGPHAYIGYFIEYGVKPHLITADGVDNPAGLSVKTLNRKMDQGSLIIGGNFVGPMVMHPGIKPHPFMRPALDTKSSDVVVAIGEYVRKRMQIDISTLPPLEVDEDGDA